MKNIFEKYNNNYETTFAVDLKEINKWIKSGEIVKNDGLVITVTAIGKKKSKYGESGFITGITANPNGSETIGINVPSWYMHVVRVPMVSSLQPKTFLILPLLHYLKPVLKLQFSYVFLP